MKKLLKYAILSLYFGFSGNVMAQIQTSTEKIGNTELTTTMDKRIQETLENLECNHKTKNTSTSTTTTNTTNTRTSTTGNKPMSQAEICRQNPRILGYKIQIAVVKSKEEADKIRTDFRSKFSNIKVEVDASMRPNYRILAGSYFTKESANPDLRKIKTNFKSATSVQYRVFCAEAK